MDFHPHPCVVDVEEVYLRKYSTHTRQKEIKEKYFPQFYITDFNGNSTLKVPSTTAHEVQKFQEPELRHSTTAARRPEIRIIPETPTGSQSHMNLKNVSINSGAENSNTNANRPATAPEIDASASLSNTRVKVLSRTVTKILVPRKNANHDGDLEITNPTYEVSKVNSLNPINKSTPLTPLDAQELMPGKSDVAVKDAFSKKAVSFKTQLVEDPPQHSSDLVLADEISNSQNKSVLTGKSSKFSLLEATADDQAAPTQKKISRIPIPVSRALASTTITVPGLPSKSTASKIGINKTSKAVMRSTPNPNGNGRKKKPPQSKATNSTELLQKTSDDTVQKDSEEMLQEQSNQNLDSVEFSKIGNIDFACPGISNNCLKGVLDETIPQLYDSDSSITTTQLDYEDEPKSCSESSTAIFFNCDNPPSSHQTTAISCSASHQHTHEKLNESEISDNGMTNEKNSKISNLTPTECLGTVSASTTVPKPDKSVCGGELKAKKSGIIQCRYNTAGCSEELPRGTFVEEEHYQLCRYRPIPCLFNRICNEIVPYHNFILHHNSHFLHPNYTSTLSSPVFIHPGDFLTGETWIPKWLSTYDNHFFLMLSHTRVQCIGTGTWICWLWMLGTPEEAGDYSYEVEIFKGPRKIGGTFTAQSVRTSAEEVEKTKSGLIFTDTVARHLAGMSKNVLGDFVMDVAISKKPSSHREKPSYTGPYVIPKNETTLKT